MSTKSSSFEKWVALIGLAVSVAALGLSCYTFTQFHKDELAKAAFLRKEKVYSEMRARVSELAYRRNWEHPDVPDYAKAMGGFAILLEGDFGNLANPQASESGHKFLAIISEKGVSTDITDRSKKARDDLIRICEADLKEELKRKPIE
jgi:hypothetical protein